MCLFLKNKNIVESMTQSWNPNLSFPCYQVTTSSPCIFGSQCGKVESGVRLPGKNGMVIVLGLHPTTSETPEERRFPFLYDNTKWLCGSLLGLTWVIAHLRGNLCGQTVGMLCVARIGSYSHPGVGWRGIHFQTTWIKGRWHTVPKGKLRCHFLEKAERLLGRQKQQMFTKIILYIFLRN